MKIEGREKDFDVRVRSEINENDDEIIVIEIYEPKELDTCAGCDCNIDTYLNDCPLNK